MTEAIRNWIMAIVCVCMLLAIAECLCPEGSVKKICRLAGGLVLILSMMNPVLHIRWEDLDVKMDFFRDRLEQREAELEQTQKNLYQTLIEEKSAAYILDKTRALGLNCRVQIEVSDEQSPRLVAVTLSGVMTDDQREQVSAMLEDDLGVPASMQYFEEKTP